MSSRTLMPAAALMALALLPAAPANAGYVSGWDLLEICKAHPDDAEHKLKQAECTGYVVGVADTFDCQEKLHGFTWNSTAHVSQSALVEHVITWLNAHPELLSHESDGLVAATLSEAFPCK